MYTRRIDVPKLYFTVMINYVSSFIRQQKRKGFGDIFSNLHPLNGRIFNHEHKLYYLYLKITDNEVKVSLYDDKHKDSLLWSITSKFDKITETSVIIDVQSLLSKRLYFGQWVLGLHFINNVLSDFDCTPISNVDVALIKIQRK